jgi:uncharacterized protein YodC (DUF2158 family)
MAVLFKKGDAVRVAVNPPQGTVIDFSIDGSGNISYVMEWTNEQGETHQRMFLEEELQKV